VAPSFANGGNSSSLDVSMSSSEIARAFRIPDRNSFSSPLIAKFTIIARRNELIARARQWNELNTSDACGSWPPNRIPICERATASERHTFTDARQLAAAHNVGRVWICRRIIYFRIKDNTVLILLYLFGFTSLLKSVSPPAPSHPVFSPFASDDGA